MSRHKKISAHRLNVCDTQLATMRQTNPELWQRHCQPGTWLDALL